MDELAGEVRRRPVGRQLALALFALLVVTLFLLWTQRLPIATDYLDREFERRGVQATYKVTKIGFRTQRVEDLVIGDPRKPDLVAKWVEVDLSLGFRRPRATLITARGVRLRGRVVNGKLRFGEVDKLLPPPTGLPFRLPDQTVDVADVQVRLDTPAGRIGMALAGKGNLASGFRGRLAAASRRLALGDCTLSGVKGQWAVSVEILRPTLKGPLRAASLGCGSIGVARPQLALNVTLAPPLSSWRGKAGLRAAGARFSGNALGALGGKLSFRGDTGETRGQVELAASLARLPDFTAARTAIDGAYTLGLDSGRFLLTADADAAGMSGGRASLGSVIEVLSSAGGTPIEPVGDALAASLSRALRGFDVAGSLRLATQPGGGAVRFDGLRAASRSGARLAVAGGGLTFTWPGGATQVDGSLALAGGGFPDMRFSLDQPRPGGPISGEGRIAPMSAGGARLALATIRFSAAPGGVTRLDTVATIDGPFEDGRVEGLVLPIRGRFDGSGGFVIGERCTLASFRMLRVATLRLGPTRLPLCPTGRALVWKAPGGSLRGGAEVRSPRFAGTLGTTPIIAAGRQVRFSLADPGFTSAGVAVRLGRTGAVNSLDLATLSGHFNRGGVAGRYSGARAKLASVPLLLTQGSGDWRVQRGNVLVGGGATISDVVEPPRFYPLVTRDFRLALQDNQIRATGWLNDPETGTKVLQAAVDHSLRTGRGRAQLDVPGINFDKDYQPEQLTRLTTGVVALVNGVLKGQGEISWDEGGTRSSGTFSTTDMDLAASFGPIEGLSTTVHFTDLLGLVSAPGQVADAGLIRTGIDVFDGRIRYQLLPGLRVKVEGGRWPFAGGELFLDETVLDFSRPSAKQLTFRVAGLDAARFVQQMEFSNISATGTFDGVIPMVFDERGGRIVGGQLIARQPGGTLSYIGELTDRQLGVYGKLAFDALKAMRYNKLTIGLDGSLDGEFIAAIELDGVARDPVLTSMPSGSGISGLVAGRALGQLAKIPFEFNITVKGPFRALLATMRSFEDPTNLIQSVLPDKLGQSSQAAPIPPVQPPESEIVR